MGRIDEAVAVLLDHEGAPALFRWREKDYQVSSRPVRWFARTEWWVGERAHRGIGSGVLEVEMWRLKSECRGLWISFELLHNLESNSWQLLRIYE
jgi:hypothetical protein